MERRAFIAAGGVALTGAACQSLATSTATAEDSRARMARTESAVKLSVCKWCYPSLSVEQLALAAKGMGLRSVELLDPEDWPAVTKVGTRAQW